VEEESVDPSSAQRRGRVLSGPSDLLVNFIFVSGACRG
jgi:hypothetical protein